MNVFSSGRESPREEIYERIAAGADVFAALFVRRPHTQVCVYVCVCVYMWPHGEGFRHAESYKAMRLSFGGRRESFYSGGIPLD